MAESQSYLHLRRGPSTGVQSGWDPASASIPNGELCVAEAKGRYYEQARRGNVFSLHAVTTTAISAGNIEAAAAAASTQFALWNPANSGYNLSLLKFGYECISGTPAGGPITHSIAYTATTIASAVYAGTAPIAHNLNSTSTCHAGYVTSAAGTALTGGSALKTLRVAHLSTTATAQASVGMVAALEDIGGDILLVPGTMWVPTHHGAGTSVLSEYSITWEEIAIP